MEIIFSDLDLKRWQEADSEFFKTVYDASYYVLYAKLYRMVLDREETEDLLQDIYMKLYQKRKEYLPQKGSWMAWAYPIAVNHALNFLRRKSLWHKWIKRQEVILTKEFEESDLSFEIRDCLGRLDETQRAILVLRELEDLSYEQIANILNLPVGTVRSRLSRARKAFREIYHEEEVSR